MEIGLRDNEKVFEMTTERKMAVGQQHSVAGPQHPNRAHHVDSVLSYLRTIGLRGLQFGQWSPFCFSHHFLGGELAWGTMGKNETAAADIVF